MFGWTGACDADGRTNGNASRSGQAVRGIQHLDVVKALEPAKNPGHHCLGAGPVRLGVTCRDFQAVARAFRRSARLVGAPEAPEATELRSASSLALSSAGLLPISVTTRMPAA